MRLEKYHKILAETPQHIKDAVSKWMDELTANHNKQVKMVTRLKTRKRKQVFINLTL